MSQAIDEAKKAEKINEVPVGAIVVKDNKVIGRGFNRVIKDLSVASHAEIIAINNASKFLNNFRLKGCQIFVTLEPCHMCAKAIVDARLDDLFFGSMEPKTGAIKSIDKFLDRKDLNHKVRYSGGYMEKESSELLKSFFKSKRKK